MYIYIYIQRERERYSVGTSKKSSSIKLDEAGVLHETCFSPSLVIRVLFFVCVFRFSFFVKREREREKEEEEGKK